ncbi:hypothetical protein C7451_10167 [Blastomonas natatoria]|uniref:ArsR family transcriptional regulator n=1 Tax=Blastomonas natatoria TaxID=34015 RepID=A0A2V3VG38_9SPHN|nr:ArsR family transcriptional regulator [Blastomonas natatoria]PXW79005.1 hypothetical protein C7451_10167 [Blastomonas natatoria]
MSGSFADLHAAHIRLCILRLLADAPGYFANDSILHQSVEAHGLVCTRDQMRGHLTWLEEQRLITILRPGASTVMVATLSERGGDVAAGKSHAPGVQKPSPGTAV